MRVGIYIDLRNPSSWQRPWAEHYARWLDLVVTAESLGASTVWLTEHHFFSDGYLPQPLTFASAIAARTKKIRIGTAVLLLALHPSIQVAEEAAIVDLISAGRLDLGVGAGYSVSEFQAFGANIKTRFSTIERRIQELREWWLGDDMTPAPVQRPIPLWGGFFKPRGARLAGQLGMGMISPPMDLMEPYLAGLAEGGHDAASARITTYLPFVLSDDPERAAARLIPFRNHHLDSYLRVAAQNASEPPPRLIANLGEDPLRGLHVFTPDQAAKFVRESTMDRPVEEIFIYPSIAGMPDDMVETNLDLLLTQLAPRISDL